MGTLVSSNLPFDPMDHIAPLLPACLCPLMDNTLIRLQGRSAAIGNAKRMHDLAAVDVADVRQNRLLYSQLKALISSRVRSICARPRDKQRLETLALPAGLQWPVTLSERARNALSLLNVLETPSRLSLVSLEQFIGSAGRGTNMWLPVLREIDVAVRTLRQASAHRSIAQWRALLNSLQAYAHPDRLSASDPVFGPLLRQVSPGISSLSELLTQANAGGADADAVILAAAPFIESVSVHERRTLAEQIDVYIAPAVTHLFWQHQGRNIRWCRAVLGLDRPALSARQVAEEEQTSIRTVHHVVSRVFDYLAQCGTHVPAAHELIKALLSSSAPNADTMERVHRPMLGRHMPLNLALHAIDRAEMTDLARLRCSSGWACCARAGLRNSQ